MAGKFEIRKSSAGYRFVLKAANGEIIATSETYKSKDSAKNGIESVKKNAPSAKSRRSPASRRGDDRRVSGARYGSKSAPAPRA